MITIVPNTTIFRKVPAQSGIFQVDLDIKQDYHNGNMEFSLSGYGSRFFAFGSDSGNYYASGNVKKYFEANTPGIERTYKFVLDQNKYDVYDEDDNPLMLYQDKPTGYCERLYVQSSSGTGGEFALILRGSMPEFAVTGSLIFPTNLPYETALHIYNSGSVPFSILSGVMSSVDYISGLNDLPKLIQPGETALCAMSGVLGSLTEEGALISLYTDHNISHINAILSPTTYSGSGFEFTAAEAPSAYYGDTVSMLYQVYNTGTTTLKFTPIVSFQSVDIPITTTSKFYTNDRIVWSGGEFYIISTGSGTAFNYRVNTVSGSGNVNTISTGTYYKYASKESFYIEQSEITSLPNENTSISLEYRTLVSGLNTARFQLSGIGVDIVISGETL